MFRHRGLTASFVLGLAVATLATGVALAETSVGVGPRTLTVSRDSGLDPAGDLVDVRGSGYDTRRGIYVAFCVVNAPETAPGPCGGGIDTAGASGASAWISSNPPPYGEGLATPYGPDGSFALSLLVSSTIGADVDCATVRCAVITRNDHTRSEDRGQDVVVPITFRAGGIGLASIGSAGPAPLVALGLVVIVALIAIGTLARRRTRAAGRAAGPPPVDAA